MCDFNSVAKVIAGNSKVAVLCTQDGCNVCPPFRKTVKEALKDKVRVVEVNVSQAQECFDTAVKMKVTGTPTLLFYENGRLKKRLYSTGDPARDKSNLEKLK